MRPDNLPDKNQRRASNTGNFAYSEGIHAERVSIGGNANVSATVRVAHNEVNTQPVSKELKDKIEELLDALGSTGAWRDPAIGQAVAELSEEIEQPSIRPARVEQLLTAIADNAKQITVVLAAVEAVRLVLGL